MSTADPSGPLVAAEVAVHEGDYDTAEKAILKALGQLRKLRYLEKQEANNAG